MSNVPRQAAPQACGAGAVDGLPTPPPSMATNSREVVCCSQFVDPIRHLVAERRRHDVLAVRATRHGIGALCSAISAIAVSVSPISRKNCTMHPARHAARRPREEAPIRTAQEWGRRGQDLRRCARPNSMKRAAHTITSAASAGMIPSPACALARATSTSSQAC